jgi:hypothetical protein
MKKLILLFLSVTLLLSACSGGASMSASGAQAWLDQPVNGTVLPLGVFPLKAHARHASGSGITRIEFLVNGVPVGAVDTDAAAPLVYGEVNWNPSAPGEYQLAARAYAADGSSESAPVQVCVSKDVKEALLSPNGGCSTPEAPAAPADGTAPTETLPPDKATEVAALTQTALAPTALPPTLTPISPTFTLIPPTFTPIPPTFTPVPPTNTPVPVDTQGPEVKSLFQTPNPTYYGGCSGSFTMQAAGTDPSGVASVQFGYRYETGSIVGPGYLVDGSFIGNATYSVTIDNNAGGQAYSTLGGANGVIRWFVQFTDSLGNVTFVTDQIAEIQFCPG